MTSTDAPPRTYAPAAVKWFAAEPVATRMSYSGGLRTVWAGAAIGRSATTRAVAKV